MALAVSAWRAAALMLPLSSAVPTAAQACSVVVTREPSPSEKREHARLAIAGASAIVDGEVVRPFVPGRQSALVLAFRVLKGPQQTYFEVGEQGSCDIALTAMGERSRLMLYEGPQLYVAREGAEPRYVDRLLRSDRRRAWPHRAGRASPEE